MGQEVGWGCAVSGQEARQEEERRALTVAHLDCSLEQLTFVAIDVAGREALVDETRVDGGGARLRLDVRAHELMG